MARRSSREVPRPDAARDAEQVALTGQGTAEQTLRQLQERYRSLAEASAQVVWIADRAGLVLEDMPDWRRLTGQQPHEIRGGGWIDAVHPDDRGRFCDAFDEAQRTVTPFELEHRLRLADGSYRHFLTRGVPVLAEDGRLREWVGTCADITERRRLEEQLVQVQKMEAVGRLAGGIAHDFNNLLAVVTGYAELSLKATDPEDRRHPQLLEILRAGERGCSLTRQLLLFSRGQVVTPRQLLLNEVVLDMETMLRRLIGEDVELRTVVSPELPPILADRGHLEQILLNLAVNARDAMPHGGTLLIETGCVELTDAQVKQSVIRAAPGPHVMLGVTDTGDGMDAETLAHIFEPFYSTKGPGAGTGLGLATVYGIMEQSGGAMHVYSEPGWGASFKLYWPPTSPAECPPDEAGGRPMRSGAERVLLVEDEPWVRQLVRDVLELNGYTVLAASSGQEALEISRGDPRPIDVLLTDVVMPGMSGRALAETIRASRPKVRTIFISGYTDDAVLRRGVSTRDATYLQKPFTPVELTRKLQEVLATADQPQWP